jgi:hypothetical protein
MMNAAQAAHDLVDHLSIQPRGVVKVSVPVDIRKAISIPSLMTSTRRLLTISCKRISGYFFKKAGISS